MQKFVYRFIVDQSMPLTTSVATRINFKAWVEQQHYNIRRIIQKAEINSFEELAAKEEDDLQFLGQVGVLSMERLRLAMWKIGLTLAKEDENFLRTQYPRWDVWK